MFRAAKKKKKKEKLPTDTLVASHRKAGNTALLGSTQESLIFTATKQGGEDSRGQRQPATLCFEKMTGAFVVHTAEEEGSL